MANDIRDILNAHGIRYSKNMGQNFLIDENISPKIVKLSGIDHTCGVLEVGPGLGALTIELSKTASFVTAVELDARLIPILQNIISDRTNVELIRGDILKLNLREIAESKMPGMTHHVCANLPYNITTPVLTKLISTGLFKSITVMVQREVAKRICAEPDSPDYGAFSVFAKYHTEPRILFDVPPECFVPRPKVFSSVVLLIPRSEALLSKDEEKMFFRVVRAAFGQRRKTLVNALFATFGNDKKKDEIASIVRACGFDVNIRGETLGIEEFMKLSAHF